MSGDVLRLGEIEQTQVAVVGGKAARLGELGRIAGVRVPAGFCVTTDAFRQIAAKAPMIDENLDRLALLDPADRAAIRPVSAGIRQDLEAVEIPGDLAAAITGALAALGDRSACAVRSSATVEDSPTTSFAGQQDTYLNVVGPTAVLSHISRCWASLFTERAVTYRLHNGFDNRKARMAVVVQQMVFPEVAGVLFTADPVTSNRKLSSVAASFGLGEALVAGLASPDVYTVRDGDIVAKSIATKRVAISASPGGGTQEVAITAERQQLPALTDAQVVDLERLGRRIEAHFGQPQDIEWCLDHDGYHIVQSRPITTLFPVPAQQDQGNHVYVSVGHQQMMTDAMQPLGLSFWQLTAARPMSEAGGRLFVDVAPLLASPTSRAHYVEALGRSDPLIGDALETILERGDFVATRTDEDPDFTPIFGAPALIETDPGIVTGLIGRGQASLAAVRRDIRTKSGSALLDSIASDIPELKRIMFDPDGLQVIRTAIDASQWINEQMEAWLGEKNAVDTLTQSVLHNVTSEMGLALLDVADAIRPHPNVVAFLHEVEGDGFLAALPTLGGGQEAQDALVAYLDTYGMRCIGEIDITRTRWSEHPSALLSMILSNVTNFEPGESRRRFEQGRREAQEKERELLHRLRATPDGESRVAETKAMIDRVRTFMGYREYPKYHMVSRYFVYKQALLHEAERLERAHVLSTTEDIFSLRFEELQEVVGTSHVDDQLIAQRKDAMTWYRTLTPPRVLTSDGEVVDGKYRRDDVPAGALVGLPVSAGVVEGRARVIVDIADADLDTDDILVTAYTDPSWTPLFVAIKGLVTEVGGLMTHGAVIAREYGLPAVVGVERATEKIKDGARIRVHGAEGYVEILT
jgi:phosphoenolpyruvate synthase/pyruvate phosphate dikinase